jgi:hypothetical protein
LEDFCGNHVHPSVGPSVRPSFYGWQYQPVNSLSVCH